MRRRAGRDSFTGQPSPGLLIVRWDRRLWFRHCEAGRRAARGWDPKLRPLTFLQTYAFVDAGKTWYIPGRFGAGGSAVLASTGGGLRLTFKGATLRFEAAKPLTRTPFETADRSWRGVMSVWTGF